ncbi:MAG: aminotransferase class IV [Bacteroidota bacterium]
MSPYIETIKLLDGTLRNLHYHQLRFERTRSHELGLKNHPRLEDVIMVPNGLDRGLFRCRVLYGKEIDRIEIEPHKRREIRSLKLVVSDTIIYDYKSSDRRALEILFQLRDSCDDILIVKNGYITDSYIANVIFWDGEGWYTSDTPLLPGTMRACLLDEGIIETRRITPDDLGKFKKIILINALNSLEEGPEISIDAVKF